MSVESNKATIRKGFQEIWNAGNFAFMYETFAPDALLHSPVQPEPLRGLETIKTLAAKLRTAFPDFRLTIEELMGEGDFVLVRYTMRGTQEGDYFGIPPTGRRVTSHEIEMFRIPDGKIAEMWLEFNVMSVLHQLGVMPPLETAPRPLLWLLSRLSRRRARRALAAGAAVSPLAPRGGVTDGRGSPRP
jgi:steroid delta-isomerase-like uncharacterized protein